jgi:hypothetical protein
VVTVEREDILQLKASDLSRLLKESTAAEIEQSKAFLDMFLEKADIFSEISKEDIEKMALLARSRSIRGNGSCDLKGCCAK